MKNKTVKMTNFELLRIVAMIMIVLFHINCHCVRFQLVDRDSIDRMSNGLFCHPAFYKKLFLVEGMMPLGIISNAVFILISGYFMVGKKIDIGKIAKKLLLQVGFAVFALTVVSAIYYKVNVPDVYTLVNLQTINEFNGGNLWFPGYYFLVVVIAAIFLNGWLEKIDEKTYRMMLLSTFAIISLGWSGELLERFAGGLRTLVCGVFLYALGGYIKRYNPFVRIRTWTLFALILVTWLLIFLPIISSHKY